MEGRLSVVCPIVALMRLGIFILTMKVAKGKPSTRKDKTELPKPVEERKIGKRKAALKADKSRVTLTKKAKLDKKDPNKPKRPPSPFFVFLEEFRKTYKEQHPNVKAVSAVGKAGGGKWKSLSAAFIKVLHKPFTVASTGPDYAPSTCSVTLELQCCGQANTSLEKAPYEAKSAQLKADYEKLMIAYNKKQESTDDEDERPGRSKSAVNDEDDEESGEVIYISYDLMHISCIACHSSLTSAMVFI
ncbi:hypothetical protein FH972_001327 [Carpinus fangiana]|uniref:HMG box domain-containing protein n=1 Tax=Carpinus fangiana TaxID=176857 RepID=A0A5N6QBD4_9ROSI|nr:hypothetical protein FH972_001327 [Carpinus fangiana]